MKKNEFLQSIKIITLGLVLSFSVGLVSAAWTQPSGKPNEMNSAAPINESGSGQAKIGGLSIGNGTNILLSTGIKTGALFSQGSLMISLFNMVPMATAVTTAQGEIFDGSTAHPLAINDPLCVSNDGTVIKCNVGSCGLAKGQVLESAPSASTPNLCSKGTPINISSGTLAWSWNCTMNGFTSDVCSSVAPSDGSYTFYSSGTFVIPTGIKKVHFDATAGGGGGGSTNVSLYTSPYPTPAVRPIKASKGGDTKIAGVTVSTGGNPGRSGSLSSASACFSQAVATGGTASSSTANSGGAGSSTVRGAGGVSGTSPNGNGGAGGANVSGSSFRCYGYGGGAGAVYYNYNKTTAELMSQSGGSRNVSIVVGAGGAGANENTDNSGYGGYGEGGKVKVYWYGDSH